jgi:hypothetical protein
MTMLSIKRVNGAMLGDREIFKNLHAGEIVYQTPAARINEKVNPLLNVEVALRKCERVGVFKQ